MRERLSINLFGRVTSWLNNKPEKITLEEVVTREKGSGTVHVRHKNINGTAVTQIQAMSEGNGIAQASTQRDHNTSLAAHSIVSREGTKRTGFFQRFFEELQAWVGSDTSMEFTGNRHIPISKSQKRLLEQAKNMQRIRNSQLDSTVKQIKAKYPNALIENGAPHRHNTIPDAVLERLRAPSVDPDTSVNRRRGTINTTWVSSDSSNLNPKEWNEICSGDLGISGSQLETHSVQYYEGGKLVAAINPEDGHVISN